MSGISKARMVMGRPVPNFLYGTAWKEERTEALTTAALAAGFVGIDTANQRKHYYEEAVGRAVRAAISGGKLKREALFLQTKFTYVDGQDHRLPYDPRADYPTQVRQSFASSLEHFGTDYLDSYLIHGPESGRGLTAGDWAVWHTMEELHAAGKIRFLGISNVNPPQLAELAKKAKVKPTFVQNRCYPSIGWDNGTRDLCHELEVAYQGFNLVRDPLVWKSPEVLALAKSHRKSVAQIIYRFALQVGMQVLTGNTSPNHMVEALNVFDFELEDRDVVAIEELR